MTDQTEAELPQASLTRPPTPPSKNKSRPGRIRERNRERILMAAEEEFSRKGFGATTVQNIADRADLPKSNVLYYFSNKKRIYYALMDDIMGRWNDVFSRVTPEDD